MEVYISNQPEAFIDFEILEELAGTVPVKGYEDKYRINKLGQVWSMNYKRTGAIKQLKFGRAGTGYYTVALLRDGKQTSFCRHKLLAEHFIPNPTELKEVNHKNGIKHDDRLENLEWCTHKENMEHASRVIGRRPKSSEAWSKTSNRTLTEPQVKEIMRLKGKVPQKKLAEKYGVHKSAIGLIHCGRNWAWLTKTA